MIYFQTAAGDKNNSLLLAIDLRVHQTFPRAESNLMEYWYESDEIGTLGGNLEM